MVSRNPQGNGLNLMPVQFRERKISGPRKSDSQPKFLEKGCGIGWREGEEFFIIPRGSEDFWEKYRAQKNTAQGEEFLAKIPT